MQEHVSDGCESDTHAEADQMRERESTLVVLAGW